MADSRAVRINSSRAIDNKNTTGTIVAKTSVELSERRFQLPALHHRAGERAPNEAASQRVIAGGRAGALSSCLQINEQFHRVADLLIDL